jgi:hypothetical protein
MNTHINCDHNIPRDPRFCCYSIIIYRFYAAYLHETNNASTMYSVADIIYLQFMVHVTLLLIFNIMHIVIIIIIIIIIRHHLYAGYLQLCTQNKLCF